MRLDRLDVDLVQALDEELPVLRIDDGLDRRAQDADAVVAEKSALVQLHTAVEGGLAAERKEDAVGRFLLDNLLDKLRRDRQEIDLVGYALRRLDGGDVGVDEDGTDPLLPKGLERLRAAVVEFTGLADLEGAASEHQDFAELLFHTLTYKPTLKVSIFSERPSNPALTFLFLRLND